MNAEQLKRILIVDDEPDLQKLLSLSFEIQGYETSTASDGVEALEVVKSFNPDLVVMDVMMPRMDGLEACRRLKSDPQTKRIPIVILSARVQMEDRLEGFQCGAAAYFSKPFNPVLMSQKIREILFAG